MKKNLFQKVICVILSVTTLLGVMAVTAFAADTPTGLYGTNRDTASTLEEMQALVGVSSYDEYREEYDTVYRPTPGLPTISVDLTDMIGGSNGVITSQSVACLNAFKENQSNWSDFGDNWDNSVYLPALGSTTWNLTVPEGADSYYYIRISYFSCITAESSISSIERKLLIDGKTPFDEARNITLDKSWKYSNMTVSEPEATTEPDGVTTKYVNDEKGYFKVVTSVKDGLKTVTTYTITQDINGNSMAPGVVQSPSWNTYYCEDATGYYHGYFRFYFAKGTHQITFAAEREPVIISAIELVPYEGDGSSDDINLPSYGDVVNEYTQNGFKPAEGNITILEAEFPDFVSDSSVYPTNDNTSCATFPMTSKAQLYNVIGENSYNALGQWAAYKFTVDKTGLYRISMRYKQSALEGMYICRTLKLAGGNTYKYGLDDGTPEIPFEEAYDTQFPYSKDWQSNFIGDSSGNVFEFYFEEGEEYTLYLECSLGSLNNLIQEVEESLAVINSCYLRILQLTGASPDAYRSYSFMEIMPDVPRSLLEQAIKLMDIKQGLEELCGTSGSHTATLETVARLLDTMGKDEGDNIAANMSNLKSYLGTLGTWINDSKKGTMILDSIAVCPSDTTKKELPKAKANFFKSTWFEITSFIYSFFTDYEAMGLTKVPDEDAVAIDVWLALGRDQSNIWRSMVDAQNGFTDSTGYAVNLKLVTGGTLLPSILSGKGPDAYMGLGSADVINYAIRDAVVGVSGNAKGENAENEIFNTAYYTYKDENGAYEVTTEYRGEENLTFKSLPFAQYVEENFVQAAMDTVTLLDVSYGLPQQMDFSMMFYRMDVLAELGQEVPETWSDLLSMLNVLQANNMEIGVSYVLALDFMLYQKGGNMWKYTDIPEYAGSEIGLDTNIALESFEYVCRLFSDYSFPISYDAANRFRTGEMPILVGGYESLYNQLVVYATEIEGLWEFCPLPGSELEDGTVNYDSLASVSATVMLHGCEGEEKFATWEFMQWQTSPDVQANYGNRMVALIGPSAKYATANKNAIKNLSWTADEREAIEDQIKNMSSIVNYPGSYIYSRYLNFAFLDAVNEGADPVDALTSYIDAINAEITRKRAEFNLPTGAPPADFVSGAANR